MKSEGAIRHKINQVRFRHLKRTLSAGLNQTYSNCKHNAEVEYPATIGHVCMHSEHRDPEGKVLICAAINDRAAKGCPLFELKRSKEEIKRDFYNDLSAMTLPQIALNYPDLAPLLWVVDEEHDPQSDTKDPEMEQEIEAMASLPVPSTPVKTPSPKMRWGMFFIEFFNRYLS